VKLVGKGLVYGVAATALSTLSCSSNPSTEPEATAPVGGNGTENVGTIALELTLPGGQSIDFVSYTVTNGAPANTVTGTYNYPTSPVSPSFVIAGVPLGAGYQVFLTCASADGAVACAGSGPAAPPASDASAGFEVIKGAVSMVSVLLTCTVAIDAGTP
jgi:hypothetical protein